MNYVTVVISYPEAEPGPSFCANMELLGGKVTAVQFNDALAEREVDGELEVHEPPKALTEEAILAAYRAAKPEMPGELELVYLPARQPMGADQQRSLKASPFLVRFAEQLTGMKMREAAVLSGGRL